MLSLKKYTFSLLTLFFPSCSLGKAGTPIAHFFFFWGGGGGGLGGGELITYSKILKYIMSNLIIFYLI